MGEFRSDLALRLKLTVTAQNQDMNALLFLYAEVLHLPA